MKNARESMIADAAAAREESRAPVTAVDPYAYGAPSSPERRLKVRQQWNDFTTINLQKDPTSKPTDDDFLMFVVDVPKRVTGMTKVDGSNAMPLSLLEDFIRHATTILEIAHDWRLSTHGNCRLKALLQACWRKCDEGTLQTEAMGLRSDHSNSHQGPSQKCDIERNGFLNHGNFQGNVPGGTVSHWDAFL